MIVVMRCWLWFGLLMAAALQAQTPQPLLRFEKGEITPVLALALDKTGPSTYILRLPPRLPGLSTEVIKSRLSQDLEAIPGLKFHWQKGDVALQFQGPDTLLLQALSRITLEPPSRP